MIQYLAAFGGGIVTGVGLLLAHQYSVRRATERFRDEYRTRRENAKLRAEIEELREIVDARERCDEARDARERGKIIGLREGRNESNYKRFEQAVNPNGQRKVQVGGAAK